MEQTWWNNVSILSQTYVSYAFACFGWWRRLNSCPHGDRPLSHCTVSSFQAGRQEDGGLCCCATHMPTLTTFPLPVTDLRYQTDFSPLPLYSHTCHTSLPVYTTILCYSPSPISFSSPPSLHACHACHTCFLRRQGQGLSFFSWTDGSWLVCSSFFPLPAPHTHPGLLSHKNFPSLLPTSLTKKLLSYMSGLPVDLSSPT